MEMGICRSPHLIGPALLQATVASKGLNNIYEMDVGVHT